MASRRKEFFPEVTDEQWNDWHWQVKNRIETLDQLKKYIRLTPDEEEGIRESLKTLRMAITPYYLSLIDPEILIARSVNNRCRPLKNYTGHRLIWKIPCMKTVIHPYRD